MIIETLGTRIYVNICFWKMGGRCVQGWAIRQPAAHSVVNGDFTIL
jgi:hypothetical protein